MTFISNGIDGVVHLRAQFLNLIAEPTHKHMYKHTYLHNHTHIHTQTHVQTYIPPTTHTHTDAILETI